MKPILLSQGKVAQVDDADFDRLNAVKWCAAKDNNTFYAVRSIKLANGKWGLERMHIVILGVSGVDHRDGDGLNNQRYNLRPASISENGAALQHTRKGKTSQFRGVCWNRREGRWQAKIGFKGKHVYLGRFDSEELAARAYDAAATKLFKQFATLNF